MDVQDFRLINKIISCYLSSKDFEKFQKSVPMLNTLKGNHYVRKIPKGSSLSRNNFKKSTVEYVVYLISFVKLNYSKADQLQIFSGLGEALYLSSFNEASLKLFLTVIEYSKNNDKFKSIRAYALLAAGRIYSEKEIWRKSNGFIKQALRLFLQLYDNEGIVKCYNLFGISSAFNNNLLKSSQYFEKCLLVLDKRKNMSLRARIEMNLGVLNFQQFNFEKSLQFSLSSIYKYKKLNDPFNIAMLKYNIGAVYYNTNRFDKALKEFDEGLLLSIKNNLFLTIGYIYNHKALTYLKKDDLELSKAFYQKSMRINKSINNKNLKYNLIETRGIIARYQGKYKASEKYFLECVRLMQEPPNYLNIAWDEYELGVLYVDWVKQEQALEAFRRSLNIYKKMNIDFMTDKLKRQLKTLSPGKREPRP